MARRKKDLEAILQDASNAARAREVRAAETGKARDELKFRRAVAKVALNLQRAERAAEKKRKAAERKKKNKGT